VAARGRQLGVDVEHLNVGRALADRVGDAVHPRVAAADDDHVLAGRADDLLGVARRAALHARDGAVALVEVVHREVHAGQVAAGDLEVAVDARPDGDDQRVVALAQLGGADVAADVDVALEDDALVGQHVGAAVDDPLLQLGVGDAEAHQPAHALVALVDGHEVAQLVQLGGHGHSGRARPDDSDRLAAAQLGVIRHDPAVGPRPLGDAQLDLLDRHGVVVDVEHARRLARRGADEAGELGEVVGRVQLLDGALPVAAVDEVVPVGDQVPQRAALVAEGDAAVHAAPALAR
jgi:hypothetical protein